MSTTSPSTAPPVNEALVRDLAGGDFLAHQRNVVDLVNRLEAAFRSSGGAVA